MEMKTRNEIKLSYIKMMYMRWHRIHLNLFIELYDKTRSEKKTLTK